MAAVNETHLYFDSVPAVSTPHVQERRYGAMAADEQRQKELALLNEVKNLRYVAQESRPCPACNMAISKTEGCNKMVCRCGQYFCYICGKAIDGYDHFG